MRKIRFREVKKILLDDYIKGIKGYPDYFCKPYVSELKACHSTDDIVKLFMSYGYSKVEALDNIIFLITSR